MRTEEIVREYFDLERWLAGLRGEIVRRDAVWAVRNDDLPLIHMANHVWVEQPGDLGVRELEGLADDIFAGSEGPHRLFLFPDATAAFERQEAFAAVGYEPQASHILLRAGEAPCVTNEEVEVRPVPHDHPDFVRIQRLLNESQGYSPAVTGQLARLRARELPAAGTRCYVGYLRGEPAGTIGLHQRGDLGVVDYVATAPAYRRRGVGVTMLCAMFEESKLAGQRRLLLSVDFGNPAKAIYERLLFTPIGEYRRFLRG